MLNEKYMDQRVSPYEKISGFKSEFKDNFIPYNDSILRNIFGKEVGEIYYEKQKNEKVKFKILKIFHYMHGLEQIIQ